MRTLDIGADKDLPYFSIEEENSALGWRGIRFTLDHPEIFSSQIRAMLKASIGFNNLHILLPMVTSVSEVEEALYLTRARLGRGARRRTGQNHQTKNWHHGRSTKCLITN